MFTLRELTPVTKRCTGTVLAGPAHMTIGSQYVNLPRETIC